MRKKKKSGCLPAVLVSLVTVTIVWVGIMLAAFFQLQDKSEQEQAEENMEESEIPYQQVESAEEEFVRKYYFEQLLGDEQKIYQEILQGLREENKEIYVHSPDARQTNMIFQYVLKDYPEIFWCDGTTTATTFNENEKYTVLEPGYSYDIEERERRQSKIDMSVEKCLAGIETDASEYDKILYVYDYIVDTVDYDLESEDNQNIYSVFVNRRSVCAGYSKAAQYLLERLGIFCTYVTGTTRNGQGHAWNLVSCEGDYYYMDTTWGDPVFQEQEGMETQEKLDYVSYDYMCCNDEELFRTHIPDEDVELPLCTEMEYNYYVVNGMYYDYYNSEMTLEAMRKTISERENPSVFKYSDSEVYAQAHEDIFENIIHRAAQELAEQYGLSQVKYNYIDDGKLNKIVIYWEYDE